MEYNKNLIHINHILYDENDNLIVAFDTKAEKVDSRKFGAFSSMWLKRNRKKS